MTETLEAAAASAADSSLQTTGASDSPGGERTGAAESPQMIGVGAERTDQTQTQEPWALAQSLTPETIVGTYEGKPVTAGELKDHLMRQADYTRKAQEVAKQRESYGEAIEFYEGNRQYLERLQSPDPAERAAVLREIAQNFEAEDHLQQMFSGQKQRDEQGRFISRAATDGRINPDEYDEDARPLAEAVNAALDEKDNLKGELEQLKGQFQSLIGGLQTAQQQMQAMEAARAIEEGWKAAGLETVDTQAAMQRVGTPLTVEDAMWLANREALLRHNAKVAASRPVTPNEPGASIGRSGISGAGMPLEKFVNATVN